jgi:hypothetical protein
MGVWGFENPTYFERIIEHTSRALSAVANTVVYNPGIAQNYFLAIYFNLINSNQTTVRVPQVWVDYAGTGAPHTPWFYEPLPPGRQTGWLGPFIITANDDVMAWQDVGIDVYMTFIVVKPVQYALGGP